MSDLTVHPQLLNDCETLGEFPLCSVLLHKNAEIPWLILVPRTQHLDFIDLPSELSSQALAECSVAAEVIRSIFHLTKINFAAIGNVVPQLHLHVVGRHSKDACWPKPVWGNLTQSRRYSSDDVNLIVRTLVTTAEFENIPFQAHVELADQS